MPRRSRSKVFILTSEDGTVALPVTLSLFLGRGESALKSAARIAVAWQTLRLLESELPKSTRRRRSHEDS